MARLDWALLCEHAYFDSMNRLCVLGVMKQLPALGLPDTITQAMFVGGLSDLRLVDQLEVTVAVITPSGFLLCAQDGSDGITIDVVREYVLVTLRGLPLTEPGTYTFRMQIGEQQAILLDLPVNDVSRQIPSSVH